jgi:cytochrome c-type biogenesis protein CcmH
MTGAATMLAIVTVTAALFGLAVWRLAIPREGWTLLAAALVFALAGYAWQGRPELPAAPGSSAEQASIPPGGLIDLRRALFGGVVPPSSFVSLADGFARAGDYARAAEFLNSAVAANPQDIEARVALGVALVLQGDGVVTPAARHAVREARERMPSHPAPHYFEGLNAAQEGNLLEAREAWMQALELAPEDAPYRPAIMAQLVQLERLLPRSAEQARPTAPR